MGFLDATSRFLLWAGIIATAASLGFLIYTYVIVVGGTNASSAQAAANVDLFMKVLLAGVIALGVATTFIFWGEEVLAPIQLMAAAALFFAPIYLPMILGTPAMGNVGPNALGAIQMGGSVFGLIAILSTIADVTSRVKLRVREGSKADQMKYGKGVKEEKDVQNVFMGKCWQLPYCRKFVREKCPIYHAKRTCWKERVGCMCEESVIQNAMEGKVIPKDQLTAAKFIPYNNKLSAGAKAERCRQCVIFNEHQKHKYKLALPLTMLGFVGAYFVGKEVFIKQIGVLIDKGNTAVNKATMQSGDAAKAAGEATMSWFKEVLLVCILLILIAYTMKVLEYLFFKAKV